MASTAGVTKPNKSNKLRSFVFTLNNPTELEYLWITTEWKPKWMVVARETGENSTPHLQGACVIGKQMAFSTIKKLTGFTRAHIETMRGTPQDSLTYCSKQDKDPFIIGTLPKPGKRNDIHMAVERIIDGQSLKDLAGDLDGGVAIVKFHRGLTFLRSLLAEQRCEPPNVYWLWGETGSGKTRCAVEFAEAQEKKDDWWISSGSLQWFDGYCGQSVAIVDDFRPKSAPNFAFLLRLFDRYPMQVPVKGGFVNWNCKTIFITAPSPPEVMFETRNQHVPEDIRQLLRRITRIIQFPNRDPFGQRVLGLDGNGQLVGTIGEPIGGVSILRQEEEERIIISVDESPEVSFDQL